MFRSLLVALSLFATPVIALESLKIIVPSESDAQSTNARVLGKYIVRYLADKPTAVIQVVPGAAGLVAANYIYNVAPKDGNVIGTFYKDIPLVGVLGGTNVMFDPTKFTWLGSNADGRKDAVIVWTNEDEPKLFGSENYSGVNPSYAIRELAKLDFKIVTGYPNPGITRLALDKKEVNAVVYNLLGIKTQKPDWLKPESGVKAWLQLGNGPNRHPEFKDVQTLHELVQLEQDKKVLEVVEASYTILRPFVAPPGIPEKRAIELRQAFIDAVKDTEYLEEANKMKIEVNLIDWKEAEKIVALQANTSKEILDRVRNLNEVKK
jgi:hypothetical protein